MLEKLGIGGGNLEREERERYRLNMVPVENQLPAAQITEQEQLRLQANKSERFAPSASSEERIEYGSNQKINRNSEQKYNQDSNYDPDYEYVELEQRAQRRDQLQQRRYLDEDVAEQNLNRNYGKYNKFNDYETRRQPLDVDVEPVEIRRESLEPISDPIDDDPWA